MLLSQVIPRVRQRLRLLVLADTAEKRVGEARIEVEKNQTFREDVGHPWWLDSNI